VTGKPRGGDKSSGDKRLPAPRAAAKRTPAKRAPAKRSTAAAPAEDTATPEPARTGPPDQAAVEAAPEPSAQTMRESAEAAPTPAAQTTSEPAEAAPKPAAEIRREPAEAPARDNGSARPGDLAGLSAISSLAPEATLFVDNDPALLGEALAAAARAVAKNPVSGASLAFQLGEKFLNIGTAAAARLIGDSAEGPMATDPKDKRFADPAWDGNPVFWALRQAYLATRQYGLDVLRMGDLDPVREGKAELAMGFLADALAPTNFPLTNPAVIKRGLDTGGRSFVDGWRNFVDDMLHNKGRPRQVDTSGFEVGRNLACTPAKVVYRSDLIEILQYLPQTEQVHEVPLLCSPPWINKYYVMDLAPGRSFIEWAVRHNRTVFAISYRNPDATMANTTMDDYLINGPTAALDVIRHITGASRVDLVGLCLGGALSMMTATYLDEIGDDRINTITLLNTMVDFANPGILGTFTDEATVAKLERKMAKRGYLEAEEMAGTFDMLRANDLIFNYVVSNWLMGQQPPAFDILAWNSDSTRMPAAMHSFYLRNCYVGNRFARGELELAGQRLDLKDVDQDLYIVAAINDHIVPWTSSYATVHHVGGRSRFVLSSGGHIAGIVNPPSPKAWFLAGDEYPESAEAWRGAASRAQGSWWEDWSEWGSRRAGPLVAPPPVGSQAHPVLGDGPGEYVRA
jgi:polyhydroxyalkanoate synthase subunit PhaC